MLERLWDMAQSRGGQLAARYAGIGLVWLASHLHTSVSAEQQTNFTALIASLAGAGVLFIHDHFAHAAQKEGDK